MSRSFLVAAVCVLAAASAGCSSSKTPTVFDGTAGVTGSTAALDQYVQITLTLVGGGTPIIFNCDATGAFSRELAAGNYVMVATRPGYTDFNQVILVVAETTTTLNFQMVALAGNVYIGTPACAVCHGAIADIFVQSGHPYKLNKVVNNQRPIYPFSDISLALGMMGDDDLDIGGGFADPRLGTDNIGSGTGTPQSYADFTYVIGGFFWKARFVGTDGYIVTGTEVQFNLPNHHNLLTAPTMTGYHNNEEKPYNCGNCHTTGWKHYDGPGDSNFNPNRQDGLAGMDGTFFAGGVQCEACHGAGSTHAQTKSATDITEVATPRTTAQMAAADMGYGLPIACGECHTRDGEKDWPSFESAFDLARDAAGQSREPMGGRIAASGGLIKHHEQYDEILGIDPDDPNLASTRSSAFMGTHGVCTTCHTNLHATVVYQEDSRYTGPEGVQEDNAACMVCHAARDPNLRTGGMKGLDCVDCHMPKLAKSAVSTTLFNGVVVGDVTSHIFRIDVGTTAQQFTTDGKYAIPNITVDYACRTCHGNLTPPGFDVAASDTFVFHNNVP